MRKIIVTGATGFLGYWCIKEMLANDIEVLAIVRDIKRLPNEFLDNEMFDYVVGDLREITVKDIPFCTYDAFYHLAWEGVSNSLKNDFSVQMHNIEMSMNMMHLCKNLNIPLFVGAGTVAEYVFAKDVMDVHEKQSPNDMYGAAKTSVHFFLEVLARQINQDFIWAVIPSTYGERRQDNNIITYTICSLLRGEKPLYGSLSQMWDFAYVKDVVRALRLIGLYGRADYTYGIGSGIYRPLRYYIEKIRDIINPTLPLGIGERDDNFVISSCVNIDDLVRDTGYHPEYSFEEGIERTIEYWRKKGL